MPMPSQIRMVFGDHHDVTLARLDEALAAGAQVSLAGGIALHRYDDLVVESAHPPVTAHTTSTTATTSVAIMMPMSRFDRRWRRNGLKPMAAWYELSAVS